MKAFRPGVLLLLALPVLQACSNAAPPAAAPPTTAVVAVPAPPPPKPEPLAPGDAHKACRLVTAAEMSAILGNTVLATPNERGDGASTCSYAPAAGSGSRAEMMISWGDGESALQMIRAMKEHDAAADLPYQGIGDDAVYQSPAAIVREGKDLFGVAIFGVTDVPSAVRKIIDTAGAKLALVAKDAEAKRGNSALASAR